MLTLTVFGAVIFAASLTATTSGREYHGILMNGLFGDTQVYDPFNPSNTHGHLHFGLPTGGKASGSAALISGQFAYFAGGFQGVLELLLTSSVF